jgi:dimethylglycine dehydrogenase
MKALGAVFGTVYGWERPGWFAPPGYALSESDLDRPDTLLNENHPAPAPGEPIREKWSFRRSNYFPFVGEECLNVRDNVGLQDMSPFAKAYVTGPGAEAWLDSIMANRIPKSVGRIHLCHILSQNGGVRSEFTVYRTGPDGFYLVSAGALERHDHDILFKLLPTDGSVRAYPITTQWGVLVLAGPRSREVLQKLTETDLSNQAFPWLTGKKISIGAAEAHALRVNFVGELGYELHHPIEMQNTIFDLLMEAGREFGIRPFGIKAMLALAVEKSYRLIGRELSIEYAAFESGLDRFVHPNKGAFVGRDALVKWREKGLRNRFVPLDVHDVTDADARGS